MKAWLMIGIVIVLPFLAILILWVWVLAADDILAHPLADKLPWPVACSGRGCVTTQSWQQGYQARVMFANMLNENLPTLDQVLTTIIRQHLVEEAWLRAPVSPADTKRYREEILGATNEDLVLDTVGLTLEEYDTTVLTPLLQQEALKQQREAKSLDELFQELANERPVRVLAFGLRWDEGSAQVRRR